MKHLILGSSGQVGTHLQEYLRREGEEVIEFDIIRSVDEDLRTYQNTKLVDSINNCDIVHFLAFDVGGSEYMKKYQDTFDFISNNVKIMNCVYDILKTTKKPFIFASSQMSNMSHSTYGLLKAIGESYARSLNGLVIKFWNVYGYEADPEKTHVITDFIEMAAKQGVIKMRTDGTEERQFLFGDDCAECILNLSLKYEMIDRDKALHITNFEWTTILDIANITSSEFDNCKVIPSESKDNVQRGIRNEPDNYILNFWKPKTELRKGIKEVIGLMKKNGAIQ